MKYIKTSCALILVVTALAAALYLPRLSQRPMHCDEAVHAMKFGELLEQGLYRYDYHQYHGPTLNYLTLIPARLSGEKKLTDVTESTMRIVPVFFGLLLVLMLILPADGLGLPAAVFAAVLTAISPAFVFYSRYYIQEILLVCFTFAIFVCFWRYTRSKNIIWALLTGVFVGLCHATKETCIIIFAAILLAGVLTFLMHCRQNHSFDFYKTLKKINCWHLFAGIAAAVTVSVLFFSSFLTNPSGILDSFRAYVPYFSRAGHHYTHIHPWYYYLKMLIYSQYYSGPIWSEAFIVFLAVIGFIVVLTRKSLSGANIHLFRFIGLYTLILTIIYSAIPYKTPWCMLGFLHGMILLAGLGAVVLMKLSPKPLGRAIVVILLLAGSAQLLWQSYLANYRYFTDSRNPYVYSHPTMDIFAITESIEALSKVHPDGHNMPIEVICPDDDYWPLPWYLRDFTNVGYWNKVDYNVPAAPVILISPAVEPALQKKLYELPPPGRRTLYMPLFDNYMELRPQIELKGFITKDLWDRYQQNQIQPAQ